ncbi:MAG: sulfite exporter TauE/SafE family protein [Saprospiraceae bacterium]
MAEDLIAFALSLIVGITLGLVGAGGSILTVPILVFIVGIEPKYATTYSLFVVGVTSLVGTVLNLIQKKLHLLSAIVFFIPSLIVMLLVKHFIMPIIPDDIVEFQDYILTKDVAIMIVFAFVMMAAALNMIRASKTAAQEQDIRNIAFNYRAIFFQGAIVGGLTAILGVGGGFLIVPALVTFAKLPIKLTIGTSLLIITINSLSGFLFDAIEVDYPFDWNFLLIFTGIASVGIFIGMYFTKFIKPKILKKGFGYFVLIMAIYILFHQLFGALFM